MAKAGKEKTEDAYYKLTEDEHDTLCKNFYQVQSMVRILHYGCNTELVTDEEVPDPLDVGNYAEAILEKLKIMEPLLGK